MLRRRIYALHGSRQALRHASQAAACREITT
jgi:hypothetical protein